MKINLNTKLETNLNLLKKFEDKTYEIDKNTALFIVDMNNGFAREGALKSDRTVSIIPNVVSIIEKAIAVEAQIVAFTDCHTMDSPEFQEYPPHCIAGTNEVELVDEIKVYRDKMTVIPKNSTNGFMEELTQRKILEFIEDKGIKKWIIVGVCSDICVENLAISLKTYFNSVSIDMDVVVPMDAIETYDAPWHNADFMNVVALTTMMQNGIKIVGSVK